MWHVSAAMARGQALPSWFHEKPSEHESDDFYVEAFRTLSSCRAIGMSVGPIPWTAIDAYADRFGMCDEMANHLNIVITAMDAVYLQHVADEQAAAAKKNR